ncbi:MAG: transposase family protein, partial [Myxococcales bacterium]|nr:transposase family protein [Myxococcales bacterium]
HSLLRSLARASEYFGGSCRQWLFDNAKTVVVERSGDAVRFHPLLLDLGASYHVQLNVCPVRKPNQKGVVERSIRYLRDRFLAARHIVSIEQGNRELLDFFDEIAHQRPHPSKNGKTVLECLEEEQLMLLPLPEPRPDTDLITSAVVDKTASVRFDCNLYSVPPTLVGKTLTLVADDHRVRLIDNDRLVARHDRSWAKRQRIEYAEHREEILAEKKGSRVSRG